MSHLVRNPEDRFSHVVAHLTKQFFANTYYICLVYFVGSGEPDSVHVVIDRHVITGQNMQSTIMAVQNLILMCTQK